MFRSAKEVTMPRPRKDSIKRWSRHGVDGYVKDVNGRAVSYIGHRKKALGMPFVESNRVRALDLHAARVNAERTRVIKRRLGIVDESAAASHTVGELFGRYVEMKVSHKSTASIEIFDRATAHLLRGVTSLPLSETDEIARRMAKNLRGPSRRKTRPDPVTGIRPPAPPIGATTAKDYVVQVRAMFAFGIQLGWAVRNPTDVLDMPRRAVDKGTPSGHRMVPIDIAREAIRRAYAIDERAALCLELMLLTAMRDEEVRAMRIWQIRLDSIEVVGKGAAPMPGESREAHRARKPKRIIPLHDTTGWPDSEVARWQRRMIEVVNRAVEIARPTEEAWLFPAIRSKDGRDLKPMSEAYLRRVLRKALTGLVVDPADYTQHGLRKSAEHIMENVLELEPYDFCDITGHDLVTYMKSYRQRRTPADIMRSITRAAGITVPAPVTEATKSGASIDRTHPHTGPRNR